MYGYVVLIGMKFAGCFGKAQNALDQIHKHIKSVDGLVVSEHVEYDGDNVVYVKIEFTRPDDINETHTISISREKMNMFYSGELYW